MQFIIKFTSVQHISLRIIFLLFLFSYFPNFCELSALVLFRTKAPVMYLPLFITIFKVRWIENFVLKYRQNLVAAASKLPVVIFSLLRLEIQKCKIIKEIEGHKKRSFGQTSFWGVSWLKAILWIQEVAVVFFHYIILIIRTSIAE